MKSQDTVRRYNLLRASKRRTAPPRKTLKSQIHRMFEHVVILTVLDGVPC